jgi:HEAT repeat protein
MARADPVESALAKLRSLAAGPATPDLLNELTAALQSKHNIVVARAAAIVAEKSLSDLSPHLVNAFDRFMQKPTTTDKGCLAKLAIAQALYTLGTDARDTFLIGIHHVQREPSFGGSSDSAAELRGTCALGLVRMGYPDALTELADLLMDPEPQARLLAVRACAYSGSAATAPLLRMRILADPTDTDLLAEALPALARLTPLEAMPLLERFLDSPDPELQMLAATALGETRRPEAHDLLVRRFESSLTIEARRPLMLALAGLRLPQSVDFLLKLVDEERPPLANEAAAMLAPYRHDPAIRDRLDRILSDRTDLR